MFTKLIVIACLISVTLAGLLPDTPRYHYPAPISPPHEPEPWKEEHWEPANYDFKYEVHNEDTGDIKRHEEKAENGKVTGFYSLVEPDGLHRRIVEYTADDIHGFVAKVRLEPWKGASAQATNQVSHTSPPYPPPAYPAPVKEPSHSYIPPSNAYVPPPSNSYVPPARKW